MAVSYKPGEEDSTIMAVKGPVYGGATMATCRSAKSPVISEIAAKLNEFDEPNKQNVNFVLELNESF